jgi:hypothetical protein
MGWTYSNPAQVIGLVRLTPKRANFMGISAQPTYFLLYNIYYIILYYYISLKKKNFQKKFKNPLKKIVIFSNIFLPILHNIGLYIYTIKYKSGIKIPGFL